MADDFDDELNALLASDDESAGPEAEMTVGEPEVIRSERPLGRTLNMAEVEAEAGPAWMRGLSQEGQDAIMRARGTINDNALFSPVSPEEEAPTLAQAGRALVTGFGDGFTGGAARVAGQLGAEEYVAPLREQDALAQRETPRLYAGANFLGARFNPLSRALGAAAEGKGVLANVAAQGLDGAVQGFARTYGDTGNVEQSLEAAGTDALAGSLMSVPTAVAGTVGSRLRAKAEDPRNQALRANEYNAERLRSAGVSSGQIDNLPSEKLGEVVALIEDMTARIGRPPTVPELGHELQQYVEAHRGTKDAAFSALAARGAEVDTNDMAGALREQKNRFSANPSVRESAKARATLEDMASGYDAQPTYAVAYDEYTPVEAYPEVAYPQPQGAQPPPLPARAPSAPPPLPAPAAAPSPRVAARAPAMPAAPPARPSARAPQRQVVNVDRANIDPASVPPDPVGALAAARTPEQLDEAMLAQTNAWHDQNAAQWQADAPPPAAAAPEDLALLMEQDMLPHLEATPGAMSPDQLIEADVAAQLERSGNPGVDPAVRRPAARALPEPQYLPPTPSARYQPPPAQPAPAPQPTAAPDPVGALAAQAGPPPLPAPPAEEFVRGVPMPPEAEVFEATRAGVPIAEWNPERNLIGEATGNAFTPPEAANQFRDPQYAASIDAMRTGMLKVDPELAHQWDANNYSEGLGTLVQKEAQKSRNLQTPGLLDYSSNKAAFIGGALGAGVGSLVLPGVGTGVGGLVGGAVGKGAGYAINRYMEPRAHAIKADWLSESAPARGMGVEAPSGPFPGGYSGGSIGNRGSGWLSGTTLEKAKRLERVGSFPVGSLTASFGDLMRDPPPPAAEPDDSGATSALSPGEFLGRDTTQAMLSDPEMFRLYADDYSQAGTDDKRAAVTERLYRTDPEFARNVFPRIQGGEIA